MNPLNTNSSKKKQDKHLLKLFNSLPPQQQQTLVQFAEFLCTQCEPVVREIATPELVPGPPGESVIKAMKRLSGAYHMIDKAKMLNETSALMAQHMMQGRAADEVILELEALFESHYRRLLESTE